MCKEIAMLQSQVCETPLYVPKDIDEIIQPEHDYNWDVEMMILCLLASICLNRSVTVQ